MKSSDPYLQWPRILLCLVTHALLITMTAHACTLPDYLQINEGEDPWFTRIRHDGVKEIGFYVRHNVLEIRHMTSAMQTQRWKCALTFRGKYLMKRMDMETREEFSACVKFIRRSKSVVQMMWSKESRVMDPALCEDNNLFLDDWPLISYKLLSQDYTPSPFRGGYSMRITDSELGENGCNYMHRPMKFESDCLTGEGVLFDFISETCLPGSVGMFIKQRTLTVASWKLDGDFYIILRRTDDVDLYCLRVPDTDKNHMNAFLFVDVICKTDGAGHLLNIRGPHDGVKYLVLHLQRYVYRYLCDDEYPQCSTVTCNSVIRHECHKSCKVCDAENPPATCSYPKRLRGSWYQTDINGYRQVNVTDSEFTVEQLGTFRCVMFPDSHPRRSKMFTTVSMFDNGCRPRYSCLKFKRLGPSVMRYTLSRSYIWPDLEKDFGKRICADNQFGMDPEPIGDLYRSPDDTGKPIIAKDPKPERVPCNLPSSYTITATLSNGTTCHGSLYEHCEDNTRLRIEFMPGCGEVMEPGATITSEGLSEDFRSRFSFTDYSCMAHFEGHYWERLLLLQNNKNEKEASCLLFTHLDASQSMQMIGGQCDKNSWNYARAGMRTPLLTFVLRPDEFPCRYLPLTTTTTSTTSVTSDHMMGGGNLGVTFLGSHYGSGHHKTLDPLSFTVTLPPSGQGHNSRGQHDHHISASYEEPAEGGRNEGRAGLSPAGNEGAGVNASSGGSAGMKFVSALRAAAVLVLIVYWITR